MVDGKKLTFNKILLMIYHNDIVVITAMWQDKLEIGKNS